MSHTSTIDDMDEPAKKMASATATFVPTTPASPPKFRLAWFDMSSGCTVIVARPGKLVIPCTCKGGKYDDPPNPESLCTECEHSYSQHKGAEPVDDTVKGTFPAV
jgi:hypothetical protein